MPRNATSSGIIGWFFVYVFEGQCPIAWICSLQSAQRAPANSATIRTDQEVLAKIDEILRWEQRVEQQKDQRFAEWGKYLCEAREHAYWVSARWTPLPELKSQSDNRYDS